VRKVYNQCSVCVCLSVIVGTAHLISPWCFWAYYYYCINVFRTQKQMGNECQISKKKKKCLFLTQLLVYFE